MKYMLTLLFGITIGAIVGWNSKPDYKDIDKQGTTERLLALSYLYEHDMDIKAQESLANQLGIYHERIESDMLRDKVGYQTKAYYSLIGRDIPKTFLSKVTLPEDTKEFDMTTVNLWKGKK